VSIFIEYPALATALGVLFLACYWTSRRPMTMVLFAVPMSCLMHLFVVVYEEPTLEHRFGPEYRAYRA
jgi:protein-S-isoprenylcysteine O-methyltransferase Ste14